MRGLGLRGNCGDGLVDNNKWTARHQECLQALRDCRFRLILPVMEGLLNEKTNGNLGVFNIGACAVGT